MKRSEDQEYFDFFEDVSVSNDWRYDHRETLDADTSDVGLSQDSVHKLTEDLMNPLPPANDESTN